MTMGWKVMEGLSWARKDIISLKKPLRAKSTRASGDSWGSGLMK